VRCRSLLEALRRRGLQVYCLLSGPPVIGRWDIEEFHPCVVRSGLTFSSKAGKLDYLRTILQNKPVQFLLDVENLNWRDLDLVISDYEPISAWMAKRREIPSIGIGHLYAFVHDIPKAGACLSHWITNMFAPVKYPLGSHWHHFNQPILPPTIADDVYEYPSSDAGHILVYLPFEDPQEITSLLQGFTGQPFRVYSGNITAGNYGNVTVKKIARRAFVEDLAGCRGVICNAGFSLISEALHLGKKVLAKPLAGQVEQVSNALAIEELGLGCSMPEFDTGTIGSWLDRPAIEPYHWPQGIDPLADWIATGNWDNIPALVKQLWPQPPAAL